MIIDGRVNQAFLLIFSLFTTTLSIIVILKSIQRLHDINLPGYCMLTIAFLHILGEITNLLGFNILILIFILILAIKKGTDGPNKYGDDPLLPSPKETTP